jgi:hypothetical protein
MTRKLIGAAGVAIAGGLCLAALYGPALRAPAAPPAPVVAAAAPAAAATAPETLRGRIVAGADPAAVVAPAPAPAPARIVLAEVATTPEPVAAVAPAPLTAKAPPFAEPASRAAAPIPVLPAPAPSAAAPAPLSPGPEAAPRRTETVIVQAARVPAAPPPVSLDRIGRGNSVTISLPRKAPA